MYKDLPLNDIEIDMVLHLHNTIREFEAKTKPVAANMNVIVNIIIYYFLFYIFTLL